MRALAALIPALFLLAGCADLGPYPSLAQRPIERELPPPDVDPAAREAADDPAIAARIAAFAQEARKARAEFDAALPAAEGSARRAGAPESQSWVVAQEALSRAVAAQASTAHLLSDFDAYTLDIARAKPISTADGERLQAALDDVQKIADFEHEQVARLAAMIRTP